MVKMQSKLFKVVFRVGYQQIELEHDHSTIEMPIPSKQDSFK